MVTNCGEGMDNRAVATILSGLSQCGEWIVFFEMYVIAVGKFFFKYDYTFKNNRI